jgi:putative DNA primase/helicase
LTNTTKTKGERSNWQPVIPIPEGTPEARFSHYARGDPLRIFTYRNAAGQLLGYVCRFMRSSGGVQQLTLTWCWNKEEDKFAWRWMQFPKLRPMYGAERLDADRTSIVLVLADEYNAEEFTPKTESQGQYLDPKDPFIPYNLVSWPGGRSKMGEVDWSPLRQRICMIWFPHSAERFRVAQGDPQSGAMIPIEKQPWRVAARRMMQTLREHGAIPVGIVEAATIEELPDGWDAIRALDSGWDRARSGNGWRTTGRRPRRSTRRASRLPATRRSPLPGPPAMAPTRTGCAHSFARKASGGCSPSCTTCARS